jgi:hypothetical protein
VVELVRFGKEEWDRFPRPPKPGELLCLLPGPTHEYRCEAAGTKWCFKCRARHPHYWVLMGDPPEVMSWYDPHWSCRCANCGEDYTRFPGTEY